MIGDAVQLALHTSAAHARRAVTIARDVAAAAGGRWHRSSAVPEMVRLANAAPTSVATSAAAGRNQPRSGPRAALASKTTEVAAPESPLTAAEIHAQHMARLSGIVMSAARHGERAQELHDRAGVRIDSALYELQQLRLHLGAVLPSILPSGRVTAIASPDVSSDNSAGHPAPSPAAESKPRLTAGRAGPSRSAA